MNEIEVLQTKLWQLEAKVEYLGITISALVQALPDSSLPPVYVQDEAVKEMTSSRPLPGAAAIGVGKHIRPKQTQVHQARIRDAVIPPLRNGTRCNLAHICNGRRSAQRINDCICFHGRNLSRLRFTAQAS